MKKILIGVIVIAVVLLIGTCGKSDSDSYEKCSRCNGAGCINVGFFDLETCPACKGTGIPRI